MAKLLNLASMWTSTTGSETISLGSAVTGFLSFANAGAAEGDIVSYGITDGDSREVGIGTYSSASATLTRDTIRDSTNSGSRITLTGSAYVYGNVGSEDLEINQTSGIVQVELYRSTLASAGRFDFDSIPGTYDHLLIRAILRSTVASTSDSIQLFFNNDTTGSNYRNGDYYYGAGSGNEAINTNFLIKNVPAASSGAAQDMGVYEILIPFYSGATWYKSAQYMASFRGSNYYGQIGMIYWLNSNAITRITVQPDGYDTDKLEAGCAIQIIGIKTVS